MPFKIDLSHILRTFRARIAVTLGAVLVENLLVVLIPLFIGLSIDGLLAGRMQELATMVAILIALGGVAVARRIYNTRAYGTIRLRLGSELQRRSAGLQVSMRTARIDMSRELVDFLEHEVPELIAAFVQIAVSLGGARLFRRSSGHFLGDGHRRHASRLCLLPSPLLHLQCQA